ncbi:MAG: DNA-binding protein WhiA [Lachnospiraceae bacterium]|nr:DNA-binding protein WhiA [Lachnospiraceae bacterium]
MSFSQDIKEELEKQTGQARHCRLAELATILLCYAAEEVLADGTKSLVIVTEHETIVRKYFTLLKKAFNIENGLFDGGEPCERTNALVEGRIVGQENYKEMLQALKMWDDERDCLATGTKVSNLLLKTSCCRRAFLRGCYLCIGSMSDPQKGYHLEFLCNNPEFAKQIVDMLAGFDIEGRIMLRRKYHVVYIKESEAISELLNIMEAHVGLMNYENTRILKEIGNQINRKANFEAANIIKSVNTANKQIADIEYISKLKGLDYLPENLRIMAEIRLEHPEESYQELGAFFDPPIGKSGVNHRLRKIGEIAEKLRTFD